MRIKGPENGTTPVDGVSDVDQLEKTGEILKATDTPAVDAAQRSGAAAPSDAVAKVAAQLRAGEITVDQAVEQLIDDAVKRQMGLLTAGREELEDELRELLRQYASTDPFLAAKIRRLTVAK